jgi:hypothetical protein
MHRPLARTAKPLLALLAALLVALSAASPVAAAGSAHVSGKGHGSDHIQIPDLTGPSSMGRRAGGSTARASS